MVPGIGVIGVPVIIDGGAASFTITLDANVSLSSLTLGGGGVGTHTLNNSGFLFESTGIDIVGASGVFNITGGGMYRNTGTRAPAKGFVGLSNSGQVNFSDANVNREISNSSQMTVQGSSVFDMAVTNQSMGILTIQGGPVSANVNMNAGLTNNGQLNLTSGTIGSDVLLNVVMTLTNLGTITSLGSQGQRRLDAALTLVGGTVQVNYPLTIGKAGATHMQDGVVNIDAVELTLGLAGGASWNMGTAASINIMSSGLLTVNDGDFFSDGLLTAAGAGNPDAVFDNVNLSGNLNITPAIDVLFSNVTMAPFCTVNNTGSLSFNLANSVDSMASLNNNAGGTMIIVGTGGEARLAFAGAWTNNSILTLDSLDASNAVLAVSTGFINNGPLNTLNLANGGERRIEAEMNNLGASLISISGGLILAKMDANHINDGTINVNNGNFDVQQSGTVPQFTNTGPINVTTGNTFHVANGNYVHGAGGAIIPTAFGRPVVIPESSFENVVFSMGDPIINTAVMFLLNCTIDPGALIDNRAFLDVFANLNLQGALLNTSPGAMVKLLGSGFGDANLQIFGLFDNDGGTLKLFSEMAGARAMVTPNNGIFINPSMGIILSEAADVPHIIQAEFQNAGLVVVDTTLELPLGGNHVNTGTININMGALHVIQAMPTDSFSNQGTINIVPGGSLQIDGGFFDANTGAINNSTGPLSFQEGKGLSPFDGLVLEGVTIQGTLGNGGNLLLINSQVEGAINNTGTILAHGANLINGSINNTVGLLSVKGLGGDSILTYANAASNTGQVHLDSDDGSNAAIIMTGGTNFTNNGTLEVMAGAGGSREFNGVLSNNGNIMIGATLGLTLVTADHDNSGTLTLMMGDLQVALDPTGSFRNTGTLTIQPNNTLQINGGTFIPGSGVINDGGIRRGKRSLTSVLLLENTTVDAGTLTNNNVTVQLLNGTFTGSGNLVVQSLFEARGNNIFNGTVSIDPMGEFAVIGDMAAGPASCILANSLSNQGIIRLDSTASVANAVLNVTSQLQNMGGSQFFSIGDTASTPHELHCELINDGAMTVGHDLSLFGINANHNNTGLITLAANRTFRVQDTPGAPGTFNNLGPIIIPTNANLTMDLTDLLNDNMSMAIFGTISGEGSIDVATGSFTNNGIVLPGSSPGTLTVVGDFTNAPGGTLIVELEGPTPVEYDLLVLTGTANLGGILDIIIPAPFALTGGEVFTVMTYAGVTSDFASVNGGNTLPGFQLVPSANVSDYQLTAQPTEIHWTGASSTDWNDPTNWTPSGPPSPVSDVFIDAPGTYSVDLTSAVAVASILLGDPGASPVLNSNGFDITLLGPLQVLAGATFNLNDSAVFDGQAASRRDQSRGPLLFPVDNSGNLNIEGSCNIDLIVANNGNINITGTGLAAATVNMLGLINGPGANLEMTSTGPTDASLFFGGSLTNEGSFAIRQGGGGSRLIGGSILNNNTLLIEADVDVNPLAIFIPLRGKAFLESSEETIARYSFDNLENDMAMDESGNERHLDLRGLTTLKGAFGQALELNGIDDTLESEELAEALMDRDSWSIEYLTRANHTSGVTISVITPEQSIETTVLGAADSAWHYHVQTWDGRLWRSYRDAQLLETQPFVASLSGPAPRLVIGRNGVTYSDGLIDELKISSTAHDDSHITETWNALRALFNSHDQINEHLPRALWLNGRPVILVSRIGEDPVIYAPDLAPEKINVVNYITYAGTKVSLGNVTLEPLSASLWRISDDSDTDSDTGSDTKPFGPGFGIDNNAIMTLANNGRVNLLAGAFNNLVGAQINGSGTLDVMASSFVCGGELSPGASPGTLRILGNATFQSTFLTQLKVAGLTPGSGHDQIIVTGSAVLGGTVEVTLIPPFTGSAGDNLPVFLWGSSSGSFNALVAPLPQSGLTYVLSPQATSLDLNINSIGPIVGPQVFLSDATTDQLYGIDAATGLLNGVVSTGNGPDNPGVANNGDLVMVPNGDGTLTVVDPIFKLELGTIPGFNSPTSAAFSPDGSAVWVTDTAAASGKRGGPSQVNIVDVAGGTIVDTLIGFPAPLIIVVHNPFNNRSYVVGGGGNIAVFDTISHNPGGGLTLGSISLTDAVLSPDGSFLFLADQAGNVLMMSTATTAIVNTIPVAGNPSGMDITDDGATLFVANGTSNLVALDVTAGTTSNVALGAVSSQDVAVVSSVDRAYVTDNGGDTIHIIQVSSGTVLPPVSFRGSGFRHLATNKSAGVAPPTFMFSQPLYQIREDGLQVAIQIDRMGDTSNQVSVQFDTFDGSAIAGEDYTGVSVEVAFPTGSNTQTVTVPILDDTDLEGTQNFLIALTPANVRGGAVILDTATVEILDWEEGLLGFSAPTYSGPENDPQILVIINRLNGADGAVSVDVNVTGGTASNGVDYNFPATRVTLADGQASATVAIPLIDDVIVEGDETIELLLANPSGGATIIPAASTAIVIIEDFEEGVIEFRAAVFQVNENKGPAIIDLTRVGGSDGLLTVNFDTSDGTATAGVDYTPVNMPFTFANGVVSKTIAIPILDDPDLEGLETVNLALSQALSKRGGQLATLEIIDDELPPQPGDIQFTAAAYSATEGQDVVTFLERVNGSAGTIIVQVATSEIAGGATSGVDYTPLMTPITFADGETGPIEVRVATIQDTDFEPDEDFLLEVTLTSTTRGLGTPSAVICTILDDDTPPPPGTLNFSAIRYTVNEPGTAVIKVIRSAGSGGEVSATVTTADGSASDGMDYEGGSFTVTFADGESGPKDLPVTILDDNEAEDLEKFTATLSNPTGDVELGPLVETDVVIIDDDRRTVKWLERVLTRIESSLSRVLQASLDSPTSAQTTVLISPAGNATLGSDYLLSSNQLVFPPNTTLASVTITLIDDNLVEPTETARLHLAGGNAAIGLPSLFTLTILDNDDVLVNLTSLPMVVLEGTGVSKVNLPITVVASLSSASTQTLTVDYSVGGGAQLGTDHDLADGSFVFPAGETTAAITFSLLDDNIEEENEDLVISLVANSGVGLGPMSTGTIHIRDDDEALVSWLSEQQEVLEDDTGKRAQTLVIHAQLSNPVDRTVYVPYSVGGDATFGEDHNLESGNLLFTQGETQAFLEFQVLGDTIQEHNENLILTLGSGKTRAGVVRRHRVLIRDNDAGQAPNTRIITPLDGAFYEAGMDLFHEAEVIGGQGVPPFNFRWEICRSEGSDCTQYTTKDFTRSYPAGVYLLTCFAEDSLGSIDPTPAVARIRIDERPRPTATIFDPDDLLTPLPGSIQLPLGTTASFFGKTNDPEATTKTAAFSNEWFFQSDPTTRTPGDTFMWPFDEVGTFNLIFRAETPDGAVARDHLIVQVYEGSLPERLVIIQPQPDDIFAVGEEIQFIAEVVEEAGKASDLEYYWHFREGPGSGMGGSNVTHSYSESGLKLVEIVARNPELGIHLTASVPIHIQSSQAPVVEINLPSDLLLQPGSSGKDGCSASAYLSAQVLDSRGHRDLSFFWVITKDDEPQELFHETPGRVCFEQGEYTVALFAVTQDGAQSEVAVRTITVKDTSDADFEPNDSLEEALVALVPGTYDEMSLDGDLDYYRIVIEKAGQRLVFKANIDGGALSMNVLNEQGVPQFNEDRLITDSGQVQLPGLEPGIYFLRLAEAGPGKKGGLDFNFGIAVLNPSLYLPGIRVDTEFDSQLGVVNTTNEQASCEAVGFDVDGNIVAEVPFELKAQGRGHFSIADLFGDDAGEVVWVQVDSTQAVIGYSRTQGRDSKEVYAVSANTKLSSELYVPHIAENVAQWFTQASVVNGSDLVTNSTIESPGQVADLFLGKGFSQDTFDFLERFGGTLDEATDWATFKDPENNASMAGVEIFGTLDGSRVIAGLALADARKENPNFTYIANNLYFTHIARNAAFYTGIALVNLGSSEQGTRITAYGEDGAKVGETIRNLQPNEKVVEIADQFLEDIGAPSEIDWVLVEADEDIVGFELFGTHDGLTLAGLEASSSLSTNLCYPFIDRDNGVAHGISVVNVNDDPVAVTFQLLDNDGMVIAGPVIVELLAKEKYTSVMTAIFPEGDIGDTESPGWLAVSAGSPLAGFELFINTVTGEEMGAIVAQ